MLHEDSLDCLYEHVKSSFKAVLTWSLMGVTDDAVERALLLPVVEIGSSDCNCGRPRTPRRDGTPPMAEARREGGTATGGLAMPPTCALMRRVAGP